MSPRKPAHGMIASFAIRFSLIWVFLLSGPAPAATAGLEGCILFPPDNIWNTPVNRLSVSPDSSAFVQAIGATASLHPDFGSGSWNGGPIGIPYNVVAGTLEKSSVSFSYADESDPGPYPIPENPLIEGGPESDGDRHILILDRDNCILYELFDARPGQGGTWQAGSGAIFDLGSDQLRPAGWTSADAAGLPILPGLIRYDEVAAGEIRHALRFTAPQTRRDYVWPARHHASSLTDPKYPPMGQRFRLKADFDVSGFSPHVQIILRALKKYGLILADNGSPWFLSGTPDPGWDDETLGDELRLVKGSDFEAVDVSALLLDSDSGRIRSEALPVNPDPPDTTAKLIFIHHSTGENWLADDDGGLGIGLRDNHYFVSDTNYGWGPQSIGDSTDIGHWWTWFRGAAASTYLSALYGESEPHSSYSRLPSNPGGENEIVLFKSCFPNSQLGGSPSDPAAGTDNPLRGRDSSSPFHTVANAKGIYNDILEYFSTRPDKLFVVITAPPLAAAETDSGAAANARALNDWLVHDWLSGYSQHNVAVFDFYHVLTSNGGNTHTNDLGTTAGNHHRYRAGTVEHEQTVAANTSAYPSGSGDSHPTPAGNRKATGEFLPLLNVYYHCWQGDGGCPAGASGPAADFTAVPLAGTVPLQVQFTDASTGSITQWSWDFGDGASSLELNPAHVFDSAGSYTVSLTVTGSEGSDTEVKSALISVSDSGDIDGDGFITPKDALCVLQKFAGRCPTRCGPCDAIACDVNADGSETPADALCILKQLLGLPGCLD